MIIVSEKALDRARARLRCELCRMIRPLDPHHLYTVGSGQIDADWNLCSACRTCHTLAHNDLEAKNAAFRLVAKREKVSVEDITNARNVIVFRLDKDWSDERIEMAIQLEKPVIQRMIREALRGRDK